MLMSMLRNFEYYLGSFEKTIPDKICMTGTDSATHKELANNLGCYFVGCARQIFNPAVNEYSAQHESTNDTV